MTWRTHLAGGLTALWLLSPLPGVRLEEAVFFAALGSLLPDLDAPVSKLSVQKIKGIPPLEPIAGTISILLGHRGPLHSFAGLCVLGCLVCLPLAAVYPSASAGLFIGCLSHLLLDACTVSGLRLLWPYRKTYRLLPTPLLVVTRHPPTPAEELAFALLMMAAAALFLPSLLG